MIQNRNQARGGQVRRRLLAIHSDLAAELGKQGELLRTRGDSNLQRDRLKTCIRVPVQPRHHILVNLGNGPRTQNFRDPLGSPILTILINSRSLGNQSCSFLVRRSPVSSSHELRCLLQVCVCKGSEGHYELEIHRLLECAEQLPDWRHTGSQRRLPVNHRAFGHRQMRSRVCHCVQVLDIEPCRINVIIDGAWDGKVTLQRRLQVRAKS
mmetsp:Transcript_92324/g.246948  ORF Transcript_92324/g.246948 Transcript_92324/m.246948 type:complete len:210 (-) Transcript_92324:124-753(-)